MTLTPQQLVQKWSTTGLLKNASTFEAALFLASELESSSQEILENPERSYPPDEDPISKKIIHLKERGYFKN